MGTATFHEAWAVNQDAESHTPGPCCCINDMTVRYFVNHATCCPFHSSASCFSFSETGRMVMLQFAFCVARRRFNFRSALFGVPGAALSAPFPLPASGSDASLQVSQRTQHLLNCVYALAPCAYAV